MVRGEMLNARPVSFICSIVSNLTHELHARHSVLPNPRTQQVQAKSRLSAEGPKKGPCVQRRAAIAALTTIPIGWAKTFCARD
jgi:hypothetical protein